MTCPHREIRSYSLTAETPPYLWACAACGVQFAPAGEHPHAALSRRLAAGPIADRKEQK